MAREVKSRPLGAVVKRSLEAIDLEPTQTYRQITVRMHHRGVVLRGSVLGAEVGSTRQYRARAGQLILSRIDARNGAIGLVPESLDGAVVTNDFWLFDIDTSKVNPTFLDHYVGTPEFIQLCQRASEGTTNRVRLQPGQFLALPIPLPPLGEQRRIVARIEELAAKIEEAQRLRHDANKASEALLRSAVDQALSRWDGLAPKVRLQSVSTSITDGDHQPPPRAETGVPFIFISNIVGGSVTFQNCKWVPRDYFDALTPSRKPQKGDILYTAVGYSRGVPCLVTGDEEFCFQRHIAIIKPDQTKATPEFLTWVLTSSDVYEQALAGSTGSAQPTVPLSAIREFCFLLPSLEDQKCVVADLDALGRRTAILKRLQTESQTELDALLPAVLDRAFRGEL